MNRRFLPPPPVPTVAFPDKEPVYGFFVKDGERIFGKISEKDLVAEVSSYLDQCDYTLIMEQLGANGSMADFERLQDVMDQYQGYDFSDPLSLVDALENLREDFDRLPAKLKEKYANNPTVFTRAVIDGEFARDVDSYSSDLEKVLKNVVDQGVGVAQQGRSDADELERRIDDLEKRIQATQGKGEEQR